MTEQMTGNKQRELEHDFFENNPHSMHSMHSLQIKYKDLFLSWVCIIHSAEGDVGQIQIKVSVGQIRLNQNFIIIFLLVKLQFFVKIYKTFASHFSRWNILLSYVSVLIDPASQIYLYCLFSNFLHFSRSAKAINLTWDLAISSFEEFPHFSSC